MGKYRHYGFVSWEMLMVGLGLKFPTAPSPIPELLILGGIVGLLVWLASFKPVRDRFGFRFKFVLKQPWRISLRDFFDIASWNGWVLHGDDSGHVYDLANGLQQAGLDGRVKFWGRKESRFGFFTEDEPLDEIPATFWRSNKIDSFSCLVHSADGPAIEITKDNRQTKTKHTFSDDRQTQAYIDIYLERKNAVKWLKNEASAFKGNAMDRLNR